MAIGSNITPTSIDIARYTTAPATAAKPATIERKPVDMTRYSSMPIRPVLAQISTPKQAPATNATSIPAAKQINVSELKGPMDGKVTQEEVIKDFKGNLAKFMQAANITDPSWIDIKMQDGTIIPIKDIFTTDKVKA
jgi:hypothetical protein